MYLGLFTFRPSNDRVTKLADQIWTKRRHAAASNPLKSVILLVLLKLENIYEAKKVARNDTLCRRVACCTVWIPFLGRMKQNQCQQEHKTAVYRSDLSRENVTTRHENHIFSGFVSTVFLLCTTLLSEMI